MSTKELSDAEIRNLNKAEVTALYKAERQRRLSADNELSLALINNLLDSKLVHFFEARATRINKLEEENKLLHSRINELSHDFIVCIESIEKGNAATPDAEKDDPIKTYSSLFKSKTQNESIYLHALEAEKTSQDQKSRNIIISGLKSIPDKEDIILIQELASDLQIDIATIEVKTRRFGLGVKEKIHVTLNLEIQKIFLQKAKNLRALTKWDNVFINPDLTKAQQEEQYLLRKCLREAKINDPSKEWIIRNNKVTFKKAKSD